MSAALLSAIIARIVAAAGWPSGAPCFSVAAKQSQSLPYAVITNVSGGAATVAHGGDSGLREARIQVDCYAATVAAACAMGDAAEVVLHGQQWTATGVRVHRASRENSIDSADIDGAAQHFARTLDFIVTYSAT